MNRRFQKIESSRIKRRITQYAIRKNDIMFIYLFITFKHIILLYSYLYLLFYDCNHYVHQNSQRCMLRNVWKCDHFYLFSTQPLLFDVI